MRTPFPLFHSHLDLAHHYWKELVQPGDTVIDATAGNGKDTAFLASLPLAHVIAIDIQNALPPLPKTTFYQQCHSTFPPLNTPVRLIVYNLGYLPGGDHSRTTQTPTTLRSIQNGLPLLAPGGALSITCYPGHPEGAREEAALLAFANTLPPIHYNICHHRFINRQNSPSLLLIQTPSTCK